MAAPMQISSSSSASAGGDDSFEKGGFNLGNYYKNAAPSKSVFSDIDPGYVIGGLVIAAAIYFGLKARK